MRVLIVGEGKSGTTALLRSISDAIGTPAELFVPTLMTPADLEAESLVVKKLLLNWKAPENKLLESFDRRVFIVRDPRDRLVSHLLYDAYNKAASLDAEQREKWLGLLQRKTKNPQDVSLVHIINAWWRLSRSDLVSHYVRALDRSTGFNRRVGKKFFTLSYEDYVDGNFVDVDSYLGLELAPGVVQRSETRVARSSTHGEWRRWFTPADVEVFRPLSHEWLRKHGYDHQDWQLTETDEPLDSSTTVDYVAGLFTRRPLGE
jgi:hypothetical protein